MPESISWDTMFSTANATMTDATARNYVGVVASHQYNSTSLLSAYTPAKTYNKELWQTEVSFIGGTPDYSIDSGVQTAMLIHNAMAGAETNAWVWWVFLNSWGDNEGLADISGSNYVVAKRLWAMGNFSRFVRPGYYMIGATNNPTTDVYVTAYKDPSSGQFAIVAINNTSSSKSVNFTMTGFTSTSVTPWLTSASANLAQQAAITPSGGAFSATLAGKSVTTFVGTTGTASAKTPSPPTNLQAQ
jgi:glucuronoarabinoxylan endo-1,4-beta-xylanase